MVLIKFFICRFYGICFRVQFFATDPSQLQEECTRHQFYLQIRRDIYLGKLNCPLSTQYLLSSYVAQGKHHQLITAPKMITPIGFDMFYCCSHGSRIG